MAKRPVPQYDFRAFGAAIKAARTGRKESRKKVCDEMYISPHYLANIETKGQHPSLHNSKVMITKIGNNLNQIAKRMNATGNVYAADVKQVKELMKQVWDTQKSMLSKQPYMKQ